MSKMSKMSAEMELEDLPPEVFEEVFSSKMSQNSQREMELQDLPPEVLENVFVHIPALDLMRTMTLVCHKWRDIILRRRFQPWKKSYFR